jgi:carboxylesterase
MSSVIPYMPGTEPYFHRGGATGFLCLHGFTASPAEMRWLAEFVAGEGMTVYTPRLAGHGTDHRDMARMRWRDWYASALDGYYLLRAQCERVFVGGLSMGGTLALLLASDVDTDGVIVLAAPLTYSQRIMAHVHWLRHFVPYTDQSDRSDLPMRVREEQTRRGEPALGRVRYDIWSTSAVAELVAVSRAAYERLPQVTEPLLLVYSQGDTIVRHDQGEIVANRVGSKVVEKHLLQASDHILTQDLESAAVFRLVADFVTRHSSC